MRLRRARVAYDFFRAVALPPLRPAAFFWAVVPPCDELLRVLLLLEPDFFPPRLDAPGEFAIFAARSFDMPFSFSFSYCFSFLTFADLLGIRSTPPRSAASARDRLDRLADLLLGSLTRGVGLRDDADDLAVLLD